MVIWSPVELINNCKAQEGTNVVVVEIHGRR